MTAMVIPFTRSPAVAPPAPLEIGDDLFERTRVIWDDVKSLSEMAEALDKGIHELRYKILGLAKTRKQECFKP
jgi:hypothetical protein